jgi:hypothetical protein
VCGDAFEAQVVEVRKQGIYDEVCGVGVTSKQGWRSTFVIRHLDVFPLWQIGSYCMVMLQKETKN